MSLLTEKRNKSWRGSVSDVKIGNVLDANFSVWPLITECFELRITENAITQFMMSKQTLYDES